MPELFDKTAAKIVLAARRGDSINHIANKIGTSYSWTYDWIEQLAEENIIVNTDTGIEIVDHEMRQRYAEMMGAVYHRETLTQEDAYIIPHFAGMEFAYTEIDAAYVWTNGGYQVARSTEDYPVFINVHDRDVERWIGFFERFGVEATINERPDSEAVYGNVHYVLFPQRDGLDVAWVDGNPVIPVDEAVSQMRENRPAYEPALEIIAKEHDLDIDASHHSVGDGE